MFCRNSEHFDLTLDIQYGICSHLNIFALCYFLQNYIFIFDLEHVNTSTITMRITKKIFFAVPKRLPYNSFILC